MERDEIKLSLSGKREIPCSSAAVTRISRTKTTPSALTDKFPFTTKPKSEARPTAYHMRARRAAS
ncbi:hypothetical protein PHMEG_00013927 [Phytophthora megakarya]|uniref:Uncharacterized protein n=1 Tax=Phytophthora megakarya TaxID=4795 RepID=A0A225W7M1_9STRA|nr:hypothetical protein PHMEG_00013927 [Phytophthora megakarya]